MGFSCELHIGWVSRQSCAPFTQTKFCGSVVNYARVRMLFQIEYAHAQTINHKVIICVL